MSKILLPANVSKKDIKLKGIPEVWELEEVDIEKIISDIAELRRKVFEAFKNGEADEVKNSLLNQALELVSQAVYSDLDEMEKLTSVSSEWNVNIEKDSDESLADAKVNFYLDALDTLREDSENIYNALSEYVRKAFIAKTIKKAGKNKENSEKLLGEIKEEVMNELSEEGQEITDEEIDSAFYMLMAIQSFKLSEEELDEDDYYFDGDELGNPYVEEAYERLTDELGIEIFDCLKEGEEFTLKELVECSDILLNEHVCKDETLIHLSKIRQRPYDLLKMAFVYLGDVDYANKINTEEYDNEYYFDGEDREYYQSYHVC